MQIQITVKNKQAIYNILKGLLVTGGPLTALLTNQFGMDAGLVKTIIESSAAILSMVGLIWLGVGGTDSATVEHAADIKGVQVHVDPLQASSSVLKVAESPANPDVVEMVGGPREEKSDEPPAAHPPSIISERDNDDDGGYPTLRRKT